MAPIIHERHTTDIQAGDEFSFRGLTGQEVDEDATVKVEWVSHGGELFYRVTASPNGSFPTAPLRAHSIPYDRVQVLIEQGIWKMKEKN